ncbi:hypothetical protein TruAng_005580 [Truncatella angustata]|nr:hypothetical protein TruAng_005580 [Truncatella angustata]
MSSRRKSQLQPGLAKKRSAYYENEFSVGREADPTKDRVRNEAIVLAELRTNVMIQDEFTFITDLSYQLSNRYQRSMSSIVINLQHGCCMMFGGSFDPAYTLTVFALPSLVQPTTNKRNAALIQSHLQESLGVAPSRGYVRFVATPEEDVACAGKTLAGEMDELERALNGHHEPGRESLKPSKNSKRLSVRTQSFATLRPSTPGNIRADPLPTPPASTDETPMITTAMSEHPPTPPADPPQDQKPTRTAARRKSFVTALFGGKTSSKARCPKTSSASPAL